MNKNKILSIGIIGIGLISLLSKPNKVMAATECKAVPETEVKYVNSTFVDINPEEYNSRLRNISAGEYYDLWTDDKKSAYDQNSILFGSTEGRVRGGFQNGFSSPGKAIVNNGVLQGLVKPNLVKNKLQVVDKYNNGETLFPTDGGRGYDEVLTNWKFPFKKESNGYYSFNSDEYHVTKDYNSKTFKLHAGSRGGFYPFNKCSDDTSSSESVRNLFFTARFDIPFLMTSDGKVLNSTTNQKEDMVFNFSGDDDVWIFVDGKLVLDLGGTHYRQSAKINFATNKTFVSSILQQDGTNKNNVTSTAFSDGMLKEGNHTLSVFYMERAGGASNLLTTFNLQSSGLEARYIDKTTNKVLDKDVFSGAIGNKLNVKAKDIEGYTLVESPEKLEYTLTEDLQVVNFYYKKNANVITKFLDELDNQEIAENEISKHIEGDRYQTTKKDIPNYTFSKVVGNESGTVGRNDITIKYYYKYKCDIKINYIDKTTGTIMDSETKSGLDGEEIVLNHKDFENYKLVEGPKDGTKSKYTKKEQEINYYYVYIGKIKVNYVVQDGGEILETYTKEDVEGTVINTSAKEFDGYKLIEKPEMECYTLDRNFTEINYYYKKLLFNLKVDMNMEKAIINQNFHALKGKIGKIEMRIKEANSKATSKIYYVLRVANTEDRTGSGKIVEKIPENYYMLPEENSDWKIQDNDAIIDLEEIKGGEWREYKLVLTKKEGVDISQTISNNVEILSTSFEETTLDDNKDKNDLVILPRTGFIVSIKENKVPITIGIITFNIITLGAIIVRARKRAKLEN